MPSRPTPPWARSPTSCAKSSPPTRSPPSTSYALFVELQHGAEHQGSGDGAAGRRSRGDDGGKQDEGDPVLARGAEGAPFPPRIASQSARGAPPRAGRGDLADHPACPPRNEAPT